MEIREKLEFREWKRVTAQPGYLHKVVEIYRTERKLYFRGIVQKSCIVTATVPAPLTKSVTTGIIPNNGIRR